MQELDLSMDNVIVVDNLPVVPPEKVDKLQGEGIVLLLFVHSVFLRRSLSFARCTERTDGAASDSR